MEEDDEDEDDEDGTALAPHVERIVHNMLRIVREEERDFANDIPVKIIAWIVEAGGASMLPHAVPIARALADVAVGEVAETGDVATSNTHGDITAAIASMLTTLESYGEEEKITEIAPHLISLLRAHFSGCKEFAPDSVSLLAHLMTMYEAGNSSAHAVPSLLQKFCSSLEAWADDIEASPEVWDFLIDVMKFSIVPGAEDG